MPSAAGTASRPPVIGKIGRHEPPVDQLAVHPAGGQQTGRPAERGGDQGEQRGLGDQHPAHLARGGRDRAQQRQVTAAVPDGQPDGAGHHKDDQQDDVPAEGRTGADQQVLGGQVRRLLGRSHGPSPT